MQEIRDLLSHKLSPQELVSVAKLVTHTEALSERERTRLLLEVSRRLNDAAALGESLHLVFDPEHHPFMASLGELTTSKQTKESPTVQQPPSAV